MQLLPTNKAMAKITFWGGKLDGTIIETSDTDKEDWHLFILLKEYINSNDDKIVGALYYYGEHYIIREFGGETIAMNQNSGELFGMLQNIKNDDFPDDNAYFF